MLDSLRKKDSSNRPAPAAPMSPYQRMSEALSPAPGSASTGHAATDAKTEAREAKAESRDTKADPAASDTRITASTPSTSAWSGTSATSAASGEESVSRLIVGPDIKLKGAEITDCDTLVVEGRVEAAMDSRVIQIAEVGTFVGKAGVDTAEIRGHFEGELTARKQLIIRAGGRVTGKIRYGKVSIEEGGELSGDVGSLSAGAASSSNSVSLQAARH
ncbi:MAG TPA: polymer-forming cytoskeletal protein [Burkholderiales bacterium]|nr:polymer-forming cytoskeletal protein [Burkholderiales bacterium]